MCQSWEHHMPTHQENASLHPPSFCDNSGARPHSILLLCREKAFSQLSINGSGDYFTLYTPTPSLFFSLLRHLHCSLSNVKGKLISERRNGETWVVCVGVRVFTCSQQSLKDENHSIIHLCLEVPLRPLKDGSKSGKNILWSFRLVVLTSNLDEFLLFVDTSPERSWRSLYQRAPRLP